MFCQRAFLKSHEPLELVKLSLSVETMPMRIRYLLMAETLDPVSFFPSGLENDFQEIYK